MITKEDINIRYRDICTLLGDLEVRIQGLKNKRDELFRELTTLDQIAAKLEVEDATPKP